VALEELIYVSSINEYGATIHFLAPLYRQMKRPVSLRLTGLYTNPASLRTPGEIKNPQSVRTAGKILDGP
jgi:hypothetical protein